MQHSLVSSTLAQVTGGSSGIGEQICRKLGDEGAVVVCADIIDFDGKALLATSRSDLRAERDKDTVESLGANAHLVRLDVRSREDWKNAIEFCDRLGGLDVLVNNAGVLDFGSFEDGKLRLYKEVVETNQVGVFLGLAISSAALKKKKGSIVNVSSVTGLKAYSGIAAYVSANWAIRGMTKAAALEFGREGVRVNSVHPGPVDICVAVPTGKRAAMKAGVDVGAMVANQPIARTGTVEEVAAAVLFLASDEASYITGAELAVDGGASLGNMETVHSFDDSSLMLTKTHREW